MKKAKIGNKLYDVTTMDEYIQYPDLYNPKLTAIEAHGKVLPVMSKTDIGPGYYCPQQNYMVCTVQKPNDDDHEYDASNIIDYGNCDTIQSVIQTNELVKNIENEILTTKDNIFNLNIGDDDAPQMKALKQAINMKNMDVRQYESRFDQYQNDIRLLRGKSITLSKLISTCDNFDISAELVLKDKEGCANPMNAEIRIDLTEGGR